MPKVGMEPIRKSQIINATLECICGEGTEKMSLEMVAKEANCSKGVVSYYFKSKDNLIKEAFSAFLRYYKIKIDSEIKKEMSAFEMLQVVQQNALPQFYNLTEEVEAKLDVSELGGIEKMSISPAKKAKLFIHFFSRAMVDKSLQEILQEVYKEDYNGISEILHYGSKTNSFRETDINKSAYTIMALYIGISMLRVVGFKPEDMKDDTDVFWGAVTSMLGK